MGTRLVFDLTIGGTDRDVWVFNRGAKTLSRVTRIWRRSRPIVAAQRTRGVVLQLQIRAGSR